MGRSGTLRGLGKLVFKKEMDRKKEKTEEKYKYSGKNRCEHNRQETTTTKKKTIEKVNV